MSFMKDHFVVARTSELPPGMPEVLFKGDAFICPTTGESWSPFYESFPGERAGEDNTPPAGYIAVTELLSARRDPSLINSRDANRATALHYATVAGDCGGVRCLLEHGADQFAATAQGATPLDLSGNRVVRATLVPVDSAVQIACGLAVQRPGMKRASAAGGGSSLMRASGASVDEGTSTVAQKRSAAENALVQLVNSGEDLNARSGIKLQAPLHIAAETGAVEVVQVRSWPCAHRTGERYGAQSSPPPPPHTHTHRAAPPH